MRICLFAYKLTVDENFLFRNGGIGVGGEEKGGGGGHGPRGVQGEGGGDAEGVRAAGRASPTGSHGGVRAQPGDGIRVDPATEISLPYFQAGG